jgi:hypothetical protein
MGDRDYVQRTVAVTTVCALLLASVSGGLIMAQNKAEISAADLKDRMVLMQKTIDDGKAERARMTAELAKANAAAARNTQTLRSVEGITVAMKGEVLARQQADAQAKQEQLVKDTAAAALAAKSAADSTHSQNAALLIVQSFMLLTLIITIGERLWNRRDERHTREVNHQWQVAATDREKNIVTGIGQIHTLVNSGYTLVLENTLKAFKATLVSLQSNLSLLKAASGSSAEDIGSVTMQIGDTWTNIADLTKQLAERQQQTDDAATRLEIDKKNIENHAPLVVN